MRYPTASRVVVCMASAIVALAGSTLALSGGVLSAAEPADLKQLTDAIAAKTPAEQYAAVDKLASMGPRAATAVPNIVTAMESKDAELRWRAARALGLIGGQQGVEALRKGTADENAFVRAQSIYALSRLQAKDEQTLGAVVARLTDPDAQVRRTAVGALRSMQTDRAKLLPLVIKTLEDADPSVVMPALHALAEAGADVVPALVEALDHQEARYWACLVLAELGPTAKPAVPALLKVLTDERPEVRLQAVIALGEIGPDAKQAVPALIKLMNDPTGGIRYSAAFALGRIGDPAAKDVLTDAAKSEDRFLHLIGIWAVAKLNAADVEGLKATSVELVRALADTEQSYRELAARALADLGAPNEVVASEIEKLLANADHETTDRVTEALASLGSRVVPYAIKALKVKERRARAMQVLARVGPEAAPAVPELIALLNDEDPRVRSEALFALAAIGPESKAAVGAAAKSLSDEDREVKLTAGYCLGKIGPEAKDAVPSLRKLLESEDAMMRLTGVWALLRIEPPSEELTKLAVPLLTAALGHERDFVRIEAALTLGDLGPSAASALPVLEDTIQDQNADVRRAAEEAIKRIQKPDEPQPATAQPAPAKPK